MALEPAQLGQVSATDPPSGSTAQTHSRWQMSVAAAHSRPPPGSSSGPPNVPQSPAQVQAYLDAHPHSSARTFEIPKKPNMGTVTGEFFIAADQVPGAKVGSPVSLRGNGRDFDPRFDVGNTKVSLSLDFKTGKGVAIVNGSHVDLHGFGQDMSAGMASAQPIRINSPNASDHDTKIGIRTRDNGDVEVKLHAAEGLDEHIPDMPLPGDHRQDVAPEIDSTLVLSEKGGRIESGDLFPSVGLYRWQDGQVQTLQQRQEHHPWDLVDSIGNTGQGDPVDNAVHDVKDFAGDVGDGFKQGWNRLFGFIPRGRKTFDYLSVVCGESAGSRVGRLRAAKCVNRCRELHGRCRPQPRGWLALLATRVQPAIAKRSFSAPFSGLIIAWR